MKPTLAAAILIAASICGSPVFAAANCNPVFNSPDLLAEKDQINALADAAFAARDVEAKLQARGRPAAAAHARRSNLFCQAALLMLQWTTAKFPKAPTPTTGMYIKDMFVLGVFFEYADMLDRARQYYEKTEDALLAYDGDPPFYGDRPVEAWLPARLSAISIPYSNRFAVRGMSAPVSEEINWQTGALEHRTWLALALRCLPLYVAKPGLDAPARFDRSIWVDGIAAGGAGEAR
jgi:hypothetical protein